MNRRVRALGVVVALFPAMLAPVTLRGVPVAHAQEDAVTKEARKRFQEGVKLFDEKKFDLARAAFLQAMALKPHPAILLNLAQTELVGGLPAEALAHFKQYLGDPATQSDPKRADAEKGIAEARTKLPRIQIAVDLAGAEVFLDNAKIGSSPMGEAIDVKPGNHTVEAKKDGKSARATVDPAIGKITMVDLKINAGAAPPAVVPPPPLPTTAPPATTAPPPPGPTAAPAITPPPQEAPAEPSPSRPGKWAAVAVGGGSVALVGLGVGVGFLISANQKDQDVASIVSQIRNFAVTSDDAIKQGRQNNPCATPVVTNFASACAKLVTKKDERDSAKSTATAGFVVGGVGAAVGVFGAFMYWRATSATTAAWQVLPVVTPDTQGMALTGRF